MPSGVLQPLDLLPSLLQKAYRDGFQPGQIHVTMEGNPTCFHGIYSHLSMHKIHPWFMLNYMQGQSALFLKQPVREQLCNGAFDKHVAQPLTH